MAWQETPLGLKIQKMMRLEVNGNNVIELVVNDKCEFEDFYSFAEQLSKKLCIEYKNQVNGFDSIWWDFDYQGSVLTLSYNIYLGIAIHHSKGNEASKAENAILITIGGLLDGKEEV
jgi:hypothetical protein